MARAALLRILLLRTVQGREACPWKRSRHEALLRSLETRIGGKAWFRQGPANDSIVDSDIADSDR